MKIEQRAAQVWALLVLAARTQQILSYTTLGRIVGIPAKGLAPILGRIEQYCGRHKPPLPRITAIVVGQDTGLPGHLFPGFEEEEREPGAIGDPKGPHAMYALRDQSRVFVYDWLAAEAPSDEDFEG
jgi:hypothetical protein